MFIEICMFHQTFSSQKSSKIIQSTLTRWKQNQGDEFQIIIENRHSTPTNVIPGMNHIGLFTMSSLLLTEQLPRPSLRRPLSDSPSPTCSDSPFISPIFHLSSIKKGNPKTWSACQ